MATVRHIGYFPFCAVNGSPEDQEFPETYSVGLTLDQTMELFWRIKSWRLEVYNEFSGFSDSSIISVAASNESELVCLNSHAITKNDDAFDPGSAEGGWGFVLFSNSGFSPQLLKSGDIFYPAIQSGFGTPTNLTTSYDSASKVLSLNGLGGSYLKMTAVDYWPYNP